MMMMMRRVMCVLAVVLCCACGYTMAAPVSATTTTVKAGQPKAVMAYDWGWDSATVKRQNRERDIQILRKECKTNPSANIDKLNCTSEGVTSTPSEPNSDDHVEQQEHQEDTHRNGQDLEHQPQESATLDQESRGSQLSASEDDRIAEKKPDTDAATTQSQTPGTNGAAEGDRGATSSTSVNTATGEDQPTHKSSPPAVNLTGVPASQETTNNNESTDSSASGADMGVSAETETEETNSTTPSSTENTTTDAPTTTPSPVPLPNAEISSIASNIHKKNKANVDSSVSPVWMRTAAPLLIVAVLFSVVVY
ncbi:uncharacterized protein TM35_000521050 [Trypanosoma theileri]|uniref:Mucin TcMUCII n=1 Tax=Trypanosoma theileri TaxID=67003 RepID=A0A1X0NH89_9TRYP|nr:uncharacterized protein TM35_000521050 [Trypanosoma theileri]ORC83961.1 hypothetical protein TM35_000521050 [Trypanosoma theileri]